MSADSCLFSAPFSFLGNLREEFQSVIPTSFQEIWKREELAAGDRTAWIVNPGQRFIVDEAALSLFPSLSVLITPSTGSNHIDRSACEKRGIAVYSLLDDRAALDQISASAEFTFLLMLNTLRRLDRAVQEVSSGRWRSREEELRGHELQGRRVGLVGFGRIGRRMARYSEAFGATVIHYDPYAKNASSVPSLQELFRQVDIVCICCALTSETTGMIGADLLALLKPNACLINTSRGEVLDEPALAKLLESRPDIRVGLDVLTGETTGQQRNSPLLRFHQQGQIVITPHIAGATIESQTQAARGALNLLKAHLETCGVWKRS